MPHAVAPKPQRLLATGLCSLSCVAVFVWQAARVTQGFAHWTWEDARQAQAAAGALRTAPLPLRDATGQTVLAIAPPPHRDGTQLPVYLVDYFYTRCQTICTALGSEFQQMQAALSAAPEKAVQLLSISIAPADDDTRALAQYAQRFKASPERRRVSAPIDTIEGERHLRSLGVVALPDGRGDYVHNGDIHLIDGSGRLHGIWSYRDWPQALHAALQLAPARHALP